ncbi:serine hydrolase [Neolewinella persica]|uniref:serine hydrolase n=1 Tax=Neolewinella persica TaxID=70998 RepID=UPI0004783062
MSDYKYKTINSISSKKERYEITQGLYQSWTFEEAIQRSMARKLKFAPGTKWKAFYSDTNYQLLGRVIETITNRSFNTMIKLIQ